MKLLFLLLSFTLISCSSQNHKQGETVAYMCDNNQKVIADYAFGFERVSLNFSSKRLVLHHYIYERGEGYQSENYLRQVSGKGGKLIQKNSVGSRKIIYSNCMVLDKKKDFNPLAQTIVIK